MPLCNEFNALQFGYPLAMHVLSETTERINHMARQRHVFPSGQVCHLWAHQSQDNARNAQGNISFTGASLVSYGHYTIGRIVKRPRRKHAIVLIQSNKYSVTTAKQIREAESATSHMVRVHVPNLIDTFTGNTDANGFTKDLDHKRNLSHFQREITQAENKIPTSRTYTTWHIKTMNEWIEEGNVYSKYFSLGVKFKSIFSDTELVEFAAKCSRKQAEREALREVRYAAQREKYRLEEAKRVPDAIELLDKWIAGEVVDRYKLNSASFILKRTALRVVGDTVQTSMGAEFPVKHAMLGLKLVRRTIASGVEWRTNGHTCHLGAFKIDHISADGTVRAGCHVVTYPEIQRIEASLDVAFLCTSMPERIEARREVYPDGATFQTDLNIQQ